MSTNVYLECADHDPPLQSEWEVGQSLSDLTMTRIRGYIENRDLLVKMYKFDGACMEDGMGNTAMRFLSQHPKCRIVIRDECGEIHE